MTSMALSQFLSPVLVSMRRSVPGKILAVFAFNLSFHF